MRAHVAILPILAACNQLLGLGDVTARDAAPDAPIRCPKPGVAPAYSTSFAQYAVYPVPLCGYLQFDVARDYGIVRCYDPVTCGELTYGGPPTRPMTLALSARYGYGVLDPDGATLYAYDSAGPGFVSLHRDGDTWVSDPSITVPVFPARFSTVARVGDTAHVLSVESDAADELHIREWTITNATWTEQGSYYTPAGLGFTAINYEQLDLSPDGLRLIARAIPFGDVHEHMYYFDRPDVASRFGVGTQIALPLVTDAYITDDCTQVFFTGLDRSFYVSRQ